MNEKIAIIGGGVTASLAVKLLAKDNDVTLFTPTSPSINRIPEIVPREAFFEAIEVDSKIEKQIVSEAASHLDWFFYSGKKHAFSSNNHFFAYDKVKLSSTLLKFSHEHTLVVNDVTEVRDIKNFSFLLDCRGFNSVTKDSTYKVHDNEDPLTCCTYIIAAFSKFSLDTMKFWIETTQQNMKRTFFVIPLGNDLISIGFSYAPEDFVSEEMLIGAAKQKGITFSKSAQVFSGTVSPSTSIVTSLLPNIMPLGEASGKSCPIREYGTMKALSQISQINGDSKLKRKFTKRPFFEEIDPHIPMELL